MSYEPLGTLGDADDMVVCAASVNAGVDGRATVPPTRLPILSTAALRLAAVGRRAGLRRRHSRTMSRTFDSSKSAFGASSHG